MARIVEKLGKHRLAFTLNTAFLTEPNDTKVVMHAIFMQLC